MKNVLTIPERLITFDDDSSTVEVEDTSSHAITQKTIKIGLSDGIQAEVLDGLAEGDQIVERPPKVIQ